MVKTKGGAIATPGKTDRVVMSVEVTATIPGIFMPSGNGFSIGVDEVPALVAALEKAAAEAAADREGSTPNQKAHPPDE
jgi:hypothetical protein